MNQPLLNTALPASSDCCAGITKQGKACPWPPIGGAPWCFMHHPEKEQERRQTLSLRGKKGGSTPRAKEKAPSQAPIEKPSEIKGENQQGGARPGAGRKPKALRHAQDIAAAEGLIVAAMPRLIDSLVKAAEGGDVSAARYLMDRVWGRVAEQAAPLAEELTPATDHQLAEVWALSYGFLNRASQLVNAQQEAPGSLLAIKELMWAMRSKEDWDQYRESKMNAPRSDAKEPYQSPPVRAPSAAPEIGKIQETREQALSAVRLLAEDEMRLRGVECDLSKATGEELRRILDGLKVKKTNKQ